MSTSSPFRRVAILGTGLIGGSFALALRRRFPSVSLVGFDRPDVLQRAVARNTVHEPAPTVEDAVRHADLIYLALPISPTIAVLPRIAGAVAAGALVTDACGAKRIVCQQAGIHFKSAARFLGGHPMAGKEVSGIENADPELFSAAPYALIALASDADLRVQKFAELLRAIRAKPVWCDAETHDWAVGVVSHLPQLVAVALARVVSDESDETGLPLTLAGKGLQDMLRLAGSPYAVWRDVLIANGPVVSRALDRLTQEIDQLRRNLSGKELEQEFRAANELFALLNQEQEKTER